MKKYILLIIILLSIISISIKAQQSAAVQNNVIWNALPEMQYGSTRDFIPVSPRAASLGIFGQIPVGNYTGTAEISVPLYEVKYKELSVPISLNYHASGIKPDLFPGPVGLGWALQCGGMITRVIKGAPDYSPLGPGDESGYGDLPITEDPRYRDEWSDSYFLSDYVVHDELLDGTSNPDEFYFNFNGHVGRFYVDHTDTFRIQSNSGETFLIKQLPEGNLSGSFVELPQTVDLPLAYIKGEDDKPYDPYADIPYSPNVNLSSVLRGFEITDSKGIKYTFGGTLDAIEFSRPGLREYNKMSEPFRYVQPMSWFLVSIESPNGYSINFNYEKETYITKIRFTDFCQIKVNGAITLASDAMMLDGLKATLINGCYLKEITFPSGKVTFTNSVATEQLDYDYISMFYPYSIHSMKSGNLDSYEKTLEFYHFTRFDSYSDVRYANTKNLYGPDSKTSDTHRNTVRGRFMPHKVDYFNVYTNKGDRIKRIEFKYTNSQTERLKLKNVNISGKTKEDEQQYSFIYNPLFVSYYFDTTTDYYGFDNRAYIPYDNFMSELLKNSDFYSTLKVPQPSFCKKDMLEKVIYPTKGYTILEYESHEYGGRYKTWPFTVEVNEEGNLRTGGPRIKKLSNFDSNGTKLNEKIYHYIKNYINGGTISSGVLAYVPQYSEKYSNVTLRKEDNSQSMNIQEFFRVSSNPIYPLMSTRGNHVTYSEVTVEEPGNGYIVYKYKNYDNGYQDKELITNISNIVTASGTTIDYRKNDEGISMKLERGQLLSEEIYDINKNIKTKVEYTYNNDSERFNENVRFIQLQRNGIDFAHQMRSYRISAGLHYTYYPYLKEKKETLYLNKVIEKTQKYTYDKDYRMIKSMITTDSQGKEIRSEISYPHNLAQSNNIYQRMVDKYMLSYPISQTYYSTDDLITKLSYTLSDNLSSVDTEAILPHQKKIQYPNSPEYIESTIIKYGKYNNPVNLIDKNNNPICVIWGYNGQYPIAEIKNISYSQLISVINESRMNSISAKDEPSSSDWQVINSLTNNSSLKDALVNTFTYDPLVGVKTMTDSRGITTYYEYDNSGRLKETYIIENGKKKSVQSYEYHYQN